MRALLVLTLGWMLAAAACGAAATPASGRVDIRGTITSVSAAEGEARENGTVGMVLIEGVLEEDTSYDRASVTVTDKTEILERSGEELRTVDFHELQEGQRVEATFTGPVAESYPVQARASRVVILEAGS